MTITKCEYLTNIREGQTFIKVEFDVGRGEVLRVVDNVDLLVKPSFFIGLKRNDACTIYTSREPQKPKKQFNFSELFSNKPKEDYQLLLF